MPWPKARHDAGIRRQIGREISELCGSPEGWSRGLERFNAVRAKQNPAQFCDVDYSDLIKEPLGTVENIDAHFGIEMTDAARVAIAQTDDESKQGPRAPKHTYSLADYGLTEDQVTERFRGL
jgi:hypothetical protein